MKLTANSPADRRVAARLAAESSDDLLTYAPTGYRFTEVFADGYRRVWYAVVATPATGRAPWLYFLRRDFGGVAGDFLLWPACYLG